MSLAGSSICHACGAWPSKCAVSSMQIRREGDVRKGYRRYQFSSSPLISIPSSSGKSYGGSQGGIYPLAGSAPTVRSTPDTTTSSAHSNVGTSSGTACRRRPDETAMIHSPCLMKALETPSPQARASQILPTAERRPRSGTRSVFEPASTRRRSNSLVRESHASYPILTQICGSEGDQKNNARRVSLLPNRGIEPRPHRQSMLTIFVKF